MSGKTEPEQEEIAAQINQWAVLIEDAILVTPDGGVLQFWSVIDRDSEGSNSDVPQNGN